jgi:uncharacterized membrane protein
MNWVLGLIGAVFGIAIATEQPLFGAVAGFLLVYLLVTVIALKSRLQRGEQDLQVLRVRVAELATLASASPPTAAASVQSEAPAAVPLDRATAATAEFASPPVEAQVAQPAEHWAERVAALAAMRSAVDGASEQTPPAAPPPLPDSVQTPAVAKPSPAQRPHPVAREPAAPGWDEKIIGTIKRWFTEGNVPVKIGVLVLFVGVAAALRYAAAQGYFTMPIEVRLAVIAAGALVGLFLGWRERVRRPAFGLSMQGGALGVLLMTVFAAYRMYDLLPPTATFALVVVLVAGAALLAVLQDAIALAALGFLGGYLAPVLISTGSNNPVGLFSYYAVLNAAVFAVSWTRSWRLLNLIGFAFTFGVGTAWGVKFYRPDLFATIEPFLVVFFVFYVAIGLLYVIRQTEHRRPWVDGTLVFGTPLLAFPLQAELLKDDRMELAFSALIVALVYAGLVYWLRRKRDERLLTEAYAALALGFATLAVPLAFSAGTTSSVWALEGAGIAWLGIRQNRKFPWLSGLALQLLAAGAYIIGQFDYMSSATSQLLLLNPAWLGAALIAIAGYALSLIHDRRRPIALLPLLLFVWASLWWLIAAVAQLDLAETLGIGKWRFALGVLAATIALAAILRTRLPWWRLGWLIASCAVLALPMVFDDAAQSGGPLAPAKLGVWAAYAIAIGWALWSVRTESSRPSTVTHVFWLWTIAFVAMVQADHIASTQHLADGWDFAATIAPLAALALGLWRKPGLFAWPRAPLFDGYRNDWFAPACLLLALAFVAGLFLEGGTTPLAYVPVLNPLELMMVAIAVLLYALCPESLRPLRRAWPYVGFALVTSATLRAVHHLHGEPWSEAVFDSGVSQMALTFVWSLLGVGSWIIGSKRGDRRLWMGGAVLMGVVLLKLIALDRHYMGDMPGIASFLAVGLLLVGVGYIAPSPPRQVEIKLDDAIKHDEVEST